MMKTAGVYEYFQCDVNQISEVNQIMQICAWASLLDENGLSKILKNKQLKQEFKMVYQNEYVFSKKLGQKKPLFSNLLKVWRKNHNNKKDPSQPQQNGLNPFETFPEELLFYLSRFLNGTTCVKLTQTCHSFKDFFQSSTLLTQVRGLKHLSEDKTRREALKILSGRRKRKHL
eukprot:Lithocolla_globosa_v1_NODE_4860_length_1350_cov_34.330502.p1 type:complete len:173 gc:universal NODE_4860_length_1350_cov_34.330502:696-178(-)